jgi:hypothetical protein
MTSVWLGTSIGLDCMRARASEALSILVCSTILFQAVLISLSEKAGGSERFLLEGEKYRLFGSVYVFSFVQSEESLEESQVFFWLQER